MKRSGTYFGPNLAVFFCFWHPERGGARPLRPPLDPPLIAVKFWVTMRAARFCSFQK